MPHYSIGDIQGCFAELQQLLEKIRFDPANDRVWFTGDLVNRGPQSLDTLRWIKNLGKSAIVILGNHDLHLLAVAEGVVAKKNLDTLDDILAAPDRDELCNWLRQQKLIHHDPHLGFTMVHAGIPPQWDVPTALARANEVEAQLQSPNYIEYLRHMYGNQPDQWSDNLQGWDRLRLITNYFTRLRFCTPQGTLELINKKEAEHAPPGYFPWYQVLHPANQTEKIIFGHWAALSGRTNIENIFALDTGCVWGHCLTAMRLEDQKLFQVPCSPKQSFFS